MILTFRCTFGAPLYLRLAEDFGSAVEIEALEFVNGLPTEWRLTTPEIAITPWRSAMPTRRTFAFHDLQVFRDGGTHGTTGRGVSLETRGIGESVVLVWLRERTFTPVRVVQLISL